MAVMVAAGGGEAGQYNGRITLLIVLSCLMATTGGIIYGYDLGISGGVTSMEPFLKKFFPQVLRKMEADTNISNYCKFDSQVLTLFTSSLYIAALVSPFFASSVTKAFGRRPSILVAGAAFLAGSALGGAAINVYMLILGRIMLGFGLGFATQSIPLYISEMALPRHRGAMNIGFDWGAGIGVLIANLTNFGTAQISGGWGWRISLAMVALPASFLIFGAIFLPETPNNLIHNSNNPVKAKRTLQRLRGTLDVQLELDDLISANSTTSRTTPVSFSTIFEKKYRPQLALGMAIPFFQQVTGINVITFYAPVLFRTMGLGENASLMAAVVIGVVTISFTFVSMLVVDRFGRRTLLMVGGIQMLTAQLVIGSVMAAKFGDHGVLSKGYAFLVLVMVCVYVGGFACSWGPLRWLIPSEIFSSEIRSVGQSVTVTVGFFCTFALSQSTLTMLCHFKAGIFFFFAGWLVAMTVFVYFLLPETKNVPMEQMDRVWREHWFWRRTVAEIDGGDGGKLQGA